jgi:large subunit ribosomal protein L30
MATIKIKQVRSKIKSPKVQKLTLEALGLKKMNAVVENEATTQILGMVARVHNLVEVIK